VLRVLILGGTTEASALARRLAGDDRFAATVSLAGVTRAPVLPDLAVRIGGFGGVDGLVAYLREHAVEAVVDATHPFAARMTRHAVAAAAIAGVALVRVDRPGWVAQAGDRWIEVDDVAAAADALGLAPRRVLLTVGRKELAPFVAAGWHHYIVRSVDPPESLPDSAELITARGPFAEADEMALLRQRRIDVVVTKNSGGAATQAKLTAARALGIPVIMVRRPAAPEVVTVADAAAAFDWLAHQAASIRRGV
jgi:precorrin-6A/cobalt-precorrin-6A reductase